MSTGRHRVAAAGLAAVLGLALGQARALAQAPPGGADARRQAIAAFEAANYAEAIALMGAVVAEHPDDGEACYYLGYFKHYLCYDSVPLAGAWESHSDEILELLRRAIALDPKLGNAGYLLGAEYGARFLRRLQAGDRAAMVAELERGRDEGGFPDWLLEYNRNMLDSCAPGALLFTCGDAVSAPAWYLQVVEKVRPDLTVIPLAALDWPWYVLTLKEGSVTPLASAPISWSTDQILALHPYKWKTGTVPIPVSPAARERHRLGDDPGPLAWVVEPDLAGTHLWARTAVLIDILRTNAWERPVHFSLTCGPESAKGLDACRQLSGVTHRLLPAPCADDIPLVDAETTRRALLDPEHFRKVGEAADRDYSRVAGILGNYRVAYLTLLQEDLANGAAERAREVLRTMRAFLPERAVPLGAEQARWIEGVEQELGQGER
jgi:hypothetical protein